MADKEEAGGVKNWSDFEEALKLETKSQMKQIKKGNTPVEKAAEIMDQNAGIRDLSQAVVNYFNDKITAQGKENLQSCVRELTTAKPKDWIKVVRNAMTENEQRKVARAVKKETESILQETFRLLREGKLQDPGTSTEIVEYPAREVVFRDTAKSDWRYLLYRRRGIWSLVSFKPRQAFQEYEPSSFAALRWDGGLVPAGNQVVSQLLQQVAILERYREPGGDTQVQQQLLSETLKGGERGPSLDSWIHNVIQLSVAGNPENVPENEWKRLNFFDAQEIFNYFLGAGQLTINVAGGVHELIFATLENQEAGDLVNLVVKQMVISLYDEGWIPDPAVYRSIRTLPQILNLLAALVESIFTWHGSYWQTLQERDSNLADTIAFFGTQPYQFLEPAKVFRITQCDPNLVIYHLAGYMVPNANPCFLASAMGRTLLSTLNPQTLEQPQIFAADEFNPPFYYEWKDDDDDDERSRIVYGFLDTTLCPLNGKGPLLEYLWPSNPAPFYEEVWRKVEREWGLKEYAEMRARYRPWLMESGPRLIHSGQPCVPCSVWSSHVRQAAVDYSQNLAQYREEHEGYWEILGLVPLGASNYHNMLRVFSGLMHEARKCEDNEPCVNYPLAYQDSAHFVEVLGSTEVADGIYRDVNGLVNAFYLLQPYDIKDLYAQQDVRVMPTTSRVYMKPSDQNSIIGLYIDLDILLKIAMGQVNSQVLSLPTQNPARSKYGEFIWILFVKAIFMQSMFYPPLYVLDRYNQWTRPFTIPVVTKREGEKMHILVPEYIVNTAEYDVEVAFRQDEDKHLVWNLVTPNAWVVTPKEPSMRFEEAELEQYKTVTKQLVHKTLKWKPSSTPSSIPKYEPPPTPPPSTPTSIPTPPSPSGPAAVELPPQPPPDEPSQTTESTEPMEETEENVSVQPGKRTLESAEEDSEKESVEESAEESAEESVGKTSRKFGTGKSLRRKKARREDDERTEIAAETEKTPEMPTPKRRPEPKSSPSSSRALTESRAKRSISTSSTSAPTTPQSPAPSPSAPTTPQSPAPSPSAPTKPQSPAPSPSAPATPKSPAPSSSTPVATRKSKEKQRARSETPVPSPSSPPGSPVASALPEFMESTVGKVDQELARLMYNMGLSPKAPRYYEEAAKLQKQYDRLRNQWNEFLNIAPKEYNKILAGLEVGSQLAQVAANIGRYRYLFSDYVRMILAVYPTTESQSSVPNFVRFDTQKYMTKENLLANTMFVLGWFYAQWDKAVTNGEEEISEEHAEELFTLQVQKLLEWSEFLDKHTSDKEKQAIRKRLMEDNPNHQEPGEDQVLVLTQTPPGSNEKDMDLVNMMKQLLELEGREMDRLSAEGKNFYASWPENSAFVKVTPTE